MWEWLLASIDSSRSHDVSFEVAWHGRLMVLGWSVMVPVGILSARYFKILPRQKWPQQLDSQAWWYTHLTLQYLTGVLTVVAVWLIWDTAGNHDGAFLHRLMGWTTVVLCGVQYLAGWFRGSKGGPTEVARTGTIRGDHFDMTPRRIAFEHLHKTVGYICLLAALIAVFAGLWITNAPRWMCLAILVWWVAVIYAFVHLQRIYGAAETYESIWGDDPALPGNKLKPIGWGIRKRGPQSHGPAE